MEVSNMLICGFKFFVMYLNYEPYCSRLHNPESNFTSVTWVIYRAVAITSQKHVTKHFRVAKKSIVLNGNRREVGV